MNDDNINGLENKIYKKVKKGGWFIEENFEE